MGNGCGWWAGALRGCSRARADLQGYAVRRGQPIQAARAAALQILRIARDHGQVMLETGRRDQTVHDRQGLASHVGRPAKRTSPPRHVDAYTQHATAKSFRHVVSYPCFKHLSAGRAGKLGDSLLELAQGDDAE